MSSTPFSGWLPYFPLALFFALGSAFGSFLNVCILRIPAGLSIIRPPSRCPRCLSPIRWWQNIPILSYFLLRGRCGRCGKSISWQYPMVETLTGLYFALSFGVFQEEPLRLGWILVLGFVCIALSGIDFMTLTLPDKIVFPFMALAFFFAPLNPWLGAGWRERIWEMTLGFVVSGGTLWVISWLGALFLKKEAMGGGDIKLLATLGAALGWERALEGLFAGSVFGALVGGILLASGRLKPNNMLPFGPFLCAGCLLAAFFFKTEPIHWLVAR